MDSRSSDGGNADRFAARGRVAHQRPQHHLTEWDCCRAHRRCRAPQTFTGDRSGPTVSISGSRGNENLFLFDGADFNAAFRNTGLNYPPPDALQEVNVLTNTFSAEYGRNAGSVINVVTRSGTNQIHGDLWEFLRNQNLNARNFFAPSMKPQLIQNQFGAAAGGPIRKDKLFIFGA